MKPRLVIVDSIQTMYMESIGSAAGSVTQVRECAAALLRVAKSSNIPIFLVGHVTKEGEIAGPRVLEHIVDSVLYLEGERFHSFRLLRGVKNRFGSTNEVGVFDMQNEGMIEVPNPSEVFLSERGSPTPGSAVVVTMEGTRPILVEVQALTTTTNFGLPRRTANGIDYNRLLLLTAVLSKRVGLALSNQDVYVNVVGGMKVSEPAIDLGVCLAIASSFREKVISSELVAIGEVGLSGELRRVGQAERRIAEAAKLGFSRCLLPVAMKPARGNATSAIELMTVNSLREAVNMALEKK
jgi:DNA repair protein RadA/Sms